MKPKINTILPIALAVILPALSIYANSENLNLDNEEMLSGWLFSSINLYLLWHLLWFLWSFKARLKGSWLFIVIALVTGLVLGIYFLAANFSSLDFKWNFAIRIILALIVLLAIQYALKAQENISRLLLEKEQIQTENYKAQLKALQAKVDPHFLFNSLNTLRSMVRQQHEGSEEFIISLSDFYRQTLKHNENTSIPLSEELAVLQSYLFLMKSRNEDAISIEINIDPSLQHFHLPTLALQIVVENCFKHNSMTSKMPLHIEIKSTEDFCISVCNNIQAKIGDYETSGFGLELLKKRYELMEIHNGVIIEKSPEQFRAILKLIRK